MSGKFSILCREAVVMYFKASQHLSATTEDNQEKLESREPVFDKYSKPGLHE
jgi:hypothetical protein